MEEDGLRRRSGMILGKFLPPHLGHVYLVDFARTCVDRLAVVVGTLRREPIPGEVRVAWMRELFPDVRVVHLTDENPQEPQEHPDFWGIWERSLRRVLPEPPACVFASEPYGARLAEILGAEFVPVDLDRTLVPISGTAIREDPLACWRFLPACVRPWYVRRVCVFGPESTGKTVLAERLARHYGTVRVAEYARALLARQGDHCGPEDLPRIARGQIASEEALARQADRVLFCDTDVLTTTLWSEALFGTCPDWIRAEAARRRYDLTLLLDVDCPWVDDAQRFFPSARREFLGRCRRALDDAGRPYVVVGGTWDERFARAVTEVDRLLAVRTVGADGR